MIYNVIKMNKFKSIRHEEERSISASPSFQKLPDFWIDCPVLSHWPVNTRMINCQRERAKFKVQPNVSCFSLNQSHEVLPVNRQILPIINAGVFKQSILKRIVIFKRSLIGNSLVSMRAKFQARQDGICRLHTGINFMYTFGVDYLLNENQMVERTVSSRVRGSSSSLRVGASRRASLMQNIASTSVLICSLENGSSHYLRKEVKLH